ncbi:unnamed protein product [Echinostoma caproni]|uniref:CCHC-type domain-containing protein n=1 Tax=Echinostoma caproni TaxID=27848 RepID=A0A183AKP1_9TREM|nr:unnamed protein product [Echinostoma caproni]
MVCYHDIHVTPRTRSGWIRAAPREVSKWFHDLPLPNRVEFFCGLLQLCTPIELRFYGSCLEELARLHYDELRELDKESNSVIDPKGEDCLSLLFKSPSPMDHAGCTIICDSSKFDLKRLGMNPLPSSFHVLTTDSLLRSKLILRLALLRSANTVSAHAYFEALMTDNAAPMMATALQHNRDQTRLGGSASYPMFSSKWSNGISSDESEDESVRSGCLSSGELKTIEEILLIYTLAAFHPAFTFDQRQRLYTYLAALRLWSDVLRGVHAKQTRSSLSQACPNGTDTSDSGVRHQSQEVFQNCSLELTRSLELHSKRSGKNPILPCPRASHPSDAQPCSVPVCRRRGRADLLSRDTRPLPSGRCSSCETRRQANSQQADLKETLDKRQISNQFRTDSIGCNTEHPRFSLDSSDDSAVSQVSSSTYTESSIPHPSTEPHNIDPGSSSDELNSTSSRTLTASDRISVIRDLVLSTNDLSVSPRNPRNVDRREPPGSSSTHTSAGPSTSRFNPSDADVGLSHFGLGKHSKDVPEYCRLAPKRHSSGSSPISTPPSEDSGSETVALTTSPTSGYWGRKDPTLFTAIPTIYSSTTISQTTCPISGAIFRYPPPFWNPTNPNVHLFGPSFYTQSYMMPTSSLWLANSPPPPGAPWAVHPSCATFAIPPVQFASVTDPSDVESRDNADPSSSSVGLCEECNDSLPDTVDCGSAANISPSGRVNPSGSRAGSTPPAPAPTAAPSTHLIPPQTLLMFCPPGPLDLLRSGLLPIDLASGQPVQYMPINGILSNTTHVTTSVSSVDASQGENVDSPGSSNADDATAPAPPAVSIPAVTNGMNLIHPLSRYVYLSVT